MGRVPGYNFLCGILRGREAGFVPAARLESLLSARSFDEAVAQLPEGPFAVELRRSPGYEGIERAARAELAQLRDLLAKYSPSADLEALVVAPLDWFNLKVAALQKLTGRRDERLAGMDGALRAADLAAMADAGRWDALPRAMADALANALSARAEAGGSTQAFELSIDRARDVALLAAARRVSPRLGDLRADLADLTAATAFARATAAGIPWTVARFAYAGHPDETRLADLAGLRPAEWPSRLGAVARPVIREVLAAAGAGGDVAAVEAARRKALVARVREWRFRPPSAEYAYWWIARKLADLANLRVALVARLTGVPEAEARGRIDDGLL